MDLLNPIDAFRRRMELHPELREAAIRNLSGPRGFLSNYPEDVVALVNGHPVTKGDILDAKRRKQSRLLARKLQPTDPVTKPCYVWVFDNGSIFPYGGSWLYVRTLKNSWQLGPRHQQKMTLRAMRLFPCGYLPIVENYDRWKAAFIKAYPYPSTKRPNRNGLALARAVLSPGGHCLLDIKYIGEKTDE